MRSALVASLCLSLVAVETAEAQTTCRRSTGRVVAQVAAGTLGAWLGGMVLWSLFDNPEGADRKVKGDAGYTPNANTAFAIGSWAGATVGVYAAGNRPGVCGKFWPTALGVGIVSVPLFLGREEPYLPVFGVLFVAPVQAAVGTWLYRR